MGGAGVADDYLKCPLPTRLLKVGKMNGNTKWEGPRKAKGTAQKQWLEDLRMKEIKIDYIYRTGVKTGKKKSRNLRRLVLIWNTAQTLLFLWCIIAFVREFIRLNQFS